MVYRKVAGGKIKLSINIFFLFFLNKNDKENLLD